MLPNLFSTATHFVSHSGWMPPQNTLRCHSQHQPTKNQVVTHSLGTAYINCNFFNSPSDFICHPTKPSVAQTVSGNIQMHINSLAYDFSVLFWTLCISLFLLYILPFKISSLQKIRRIKAKSRKDNSIYYSAGFQSHCN